MHLLLNLPMLSLLLTSRCSITMVTANAMAIANCVGPFELMMVRACPVNHWYALVRLLPLFELIYVPRHVAASSSRLFIQSIIGPMFHFLLDLITWVHFDPSGVMSTTVDTNIIMHQIIPDPTMFIITAINRSMARCSHHIDSCFIITIGVIKVIRIWIATSFNIVTLSHSFCLTAHGHQKSSTSFSSMSIVVSDSDSVDAVAWSAFAQLFFVVHVVITSSSSLAFDGFVLPPHFPPHFPLVSTQHQCHGAPLCFMILLVGLGLMFFVHHRQRRRT
jgi:phage tail protein X